MPFHAYPPSKRGDTETIMVIIKRGSPNYSPENEKRNRRSTGALSSFAEKGYAIILKNELKKNNFDPLHAVILGITKRGTKK